MSASRGVQALLLATALLAGTPAPSCAATGALAPPVESAITHIDRMLAALSNVEIREKISRFAKRGAASRQVDAFEARVSIANGVEQYADVIQKNANGAEGERRPYGHISEISGLWSFGEIFTMLRTTRDILASTGGTPGADPRTILFHAEAAAQRWFVANGRRIGWIGFDGAVQLSNTGEVERVTWLSGAGPSWSGIDSSRWEVDFDVVKPGGMEVASPSASIYLITRSRARKAEWNLTEYTVAGRYGATSHVYYDGPAGSRSYGDAKRH